MPLMKPRHLCPRTVASSSLAGAALLLGAPAHAVQADLEASESRLSAPFASQQSQLLRLSWSGNHESLAQASIERKKAFGEQASVLVGSYAWNLNEVNRLGLAMAFSDAASIAARWRFDAQYSRTLLPQRNLVASVGGFVSHTADGHSDRSLIGSAAWYFADRQVLEGGLRWAASNPGAQSAARAFGVYTYGAVGESTLSVRLEAGREAYQTLGDNVAVANFASREVAVAGRLWLNADAGLGLNAAHYRNPTYRKNTLGLVGFFRF